MLALLAASMPPITLPQRASRCAPRRPTVFSKSCSDFSVPALAASSWAATSGERVAGSRNERQRRRAFPKTRHEAHSSKDSPPTLHLQNHRRSIAFGSAEPECPFRV